MSEIQPQIKRSSPPILCHGIEYCKIDHPRYKYMLLRNHADRVYTRAGHIFLPIFFLKGGWAWSYKAIMFVKAGYCWNGASGPTIDTPSSMRGSLMHDVGYQALREKHLPWTWRKVIDINLRLDCIEDGMIRARAWAWYWCVRVFGWLAARPK